MNSRSQDFLLGCDIDAVFTRNNLGKKKRRGEKGKRKEKVGCSTRVGPVTTTFSS